MFTIFINLFKGDAVYSDKTTITLTRKLSAKSGLSGIVLSIGIIMIPFDHCVANVGPCPEFSPRAVVDSCVKSILCNQDYIAAPLGCRDNSSDASCYIPCKRVKNPFTLCLPDYKNECHSYTVNEIDEG